MPIKRRLDKRRKAVAPEAWEMFFQCGHDFMGDLDPLGLPDPLRCPPDSDGRADAQTAWDEAARDAWLQHGAAYMRQWQQQPDRAQPWALETYGPPDAIGGSHAD